MGRRIQLFPGLGAALLLVSGCAPVSLDAARAEP